MTNQNQANQVKLSETICGDFIKFSKNSKVNWYIAYKIESTRENYLEMWSSNDRKRTITSESESWNKTVIKITKEEAENSDYA